MEFKVHLCVRNMMEIITWWFESSDFIQIFIDLYITLLFHNSWTNSVVCLYINWRFTEVFSYLDCPFCILYRVYTLYIHIFHTAYTTYCNCYTFNTVKTPFIPTPYNYVKTAFGCFSIFFYTMVRSEWMRSEGVFCVCVNGWFVLWLKSNKPGTHEKFIVHSTT